MKQPSVIRKNGSIVSTNMIYLARYAKHLGFQQRLEITRTDQMMTDGDAIDSGTGTHDDLVTENVSVKDFVPAMKAICDKLAKAEGKVCSEHDLNPHTYFSGLNLCLLHIYYFPKGSGCLRYEKRPWLSGGSWS